MGFGSEDLPIASLPYFPFNSIHPATILSESIIINNYIIDVLIGSIFRIKHMDYKGPMKHYLVFHKTACYSLENWI